MPNPMEILETGVTIGTSTSTGTASAPAFDCAYPANFTGTATFSGGVAGVNKIKINNKDYILRMGETGAEGYLTFVIVKNYINQIPLSINSDGSEYVGTNGEDGYKVNYRLNSSGVEVAATGVNVTGFMPIKKGDTVYIKNITIPRNETGGMNDFTYLSLYNSSFELVSSTKFNGWNSSLEYLVKNFTTDSNGYVTSFYIQDTYNNLDGGYFRISAVGINDDSIIAINTPIE